MPSPFPGMDPYLERPALWPDVHADLIGAIRQHLNAVLPERYVARTDRHVWLVEPDAETRGLVGRPDVDLTEGEPTPRRSAGSAVAEPVATPVPTVLIGVVRVEGHRRLRILDRDGRRVVTAIELLSPANKEPGPDRDRYLTKRLDYLAGDANLVEIDLIRAGPRLTVGRAVATAYCAFVARPTRLPAADLYPIPLRDPLPTISVPLGGGDPDVPLPLQPLFDAVYDRGRFAGDAAYTQPPPAPPLTAADAAWVRERLATWEGGR